MTIHSHHRCHPQSFPITRNLVYKSNFLVPHPAHKRTFLLPASEGWRACLAWASDPDCANADERSEMLSFAAANADEVDIARIFAAKKSTGAALSGRKRKAGDDESAEKRPGTVCAHKTYFQHGYILDSLANLSNFNYAETQRFGGENSFCHFRGQICRDQSFRKMRDWRNDVLQSWPC